MHHPPLKKQKAPARAPSEALGNISENIRSEFSPAKQAAGQELIADMADWKVSLQRRIRRQQLIFEFLDCEDTAGIDLLYEEVGQFRRIVRALAWRGSP